MAFTATSPQHRAAAPLARPVELICFALIVAHAVYLAASYVHGIWLVGPDGRSLPADFVGVWAAGRLAIMGHAAAAYDWPVHKLVEEGAVGHHFGGDYSWHYPPPFLFVAAGLSLLPYIVAYLVWAFGTFPIYVAAIRGIIGDRIGYLLAAAFPAVLANFILGQNGFLTAGLVGGTLTLIERRPLVAGLLLGLLTYKPHLGLLFPIALLAGGYWRVFITAGIVAALMAAASWAAFGSDSWYAFFADVGHASQAFLVDNGADWGKLQTVFGLIRTLGGSDALGWTLQIVMALVAAGAIAALWHSRAAYEIKAAALGTGAMVVTPYLFTYDLIVLAVPLAFLFRLGRAGGFLSCEIPGIGLACLLILIFPAVDLPVGFAAVLIIAALIARRALASQHDSSESGPASVIADRS